MSNRGQPTTNQLLGLIRIQMIVIHKYSIHMPSDRYYSSGVIIKAYLLKIFKDCLIGHPVKKQTRNRKSSRWRKKEKWIQKSLS